MLPIGCYAIIIRLCRTEIETGVQLIVIVNSSNFRSKRLHCRTFHSRNVTSQQIFHRIRVVFRFELLHQSALQYPFDSHRSRFFSNFGSHDLRVANNVIEFNSVSFHINSIYEFHKFNAKLVLFNINKRVTIIDDRALLSISNEALSVICFSISKQNLMPCLDRIHINITHTRYQIIIYSKRNFPFEYSSIRWAYILRAIQKNRCKIILGELKHNAQAYVDFQTI